MNDPHLLVRIRGCGYGVMARATYRGIPEPVKRARVEILAICPTHELATWLFKHLPQDWRPDGLDKGS